MAGKFVDRSEGWNDVAEQFMAMRSTTGVRLVRSWARDSLPQSGSVADIGCGSGVPIAQALIEEGFEVFGIDASPILIAAFQRRFPGVFSACETAQDSAYFHRKFDGAVCVGLLFLLTEKDQQQVIRRVANSLMAGGRFLFSAPREKCEWRDTLTGRNSMSLGSEEYERLLRETGLEPVGSCVDEGGNNYYNAAKPVDGLIL